MFLSWESIKKTRNFKNLVKKLKQTDVVLFEENELQAHCIAACATNCLCSFDRTRLDEVNMKKPGLVWLGLAWFANTKDILATYLNKSPLLTSHTARAPCICR